MERRNFSCYAVASLTKFLKLAFMSVRIAGRSLSILVEESTVSRSLAVQTTNTIESGGLS